MPLTSPNFVAGGSIYPFRFVKLDSSADAVTPAGSFTVLQCGTNGNTMGISMPGTDYPPLNDSHVTVGGYAAILGESLQVYGLGEVCLLEIGDTVHTGDYLKSDTNGKGVPTAASGTTLQYGGARALQSGVTGDKILVQVERQVFHIALT